MSGIGAISGAMSHVIAMKVPPGPPLAAAGRGAPDNDGDSDHGGGTGSAGKLVNISA